MRVAEYKQTGTTAAQATVPAIIGEDGETIEPERVELVELPVMGIVYRDMTPEEEAETLAHQAEMEAYEAARPRTAEELVSELTAKVDALMEFQGLTGRWDGSAFIIEKQTEFPSGDYLRPIPWTAGMAVELGKWYYDTDPALPAECVQSGVAVSYGVPWLDVIG